MFRTENKNMKIKKGDKIKITIGKDKGKTGVVEKVYKNSNKVLITGMNLYKRHVKKNEKMPQGGIVEIPRPMNVSKLNFVCPKCAKVTRIGFKIEKNLPAGRQGKKFRICKKCDSKI
ncbi:MAG: 50S ribosomal protein L24 [Candidatus Roizmanbacteria bacterium GW2011_GWA2_33_33]|uniref:Large ribosomal subunit protein uL24 n=2 Tax=Candidatus Roizmaniibacteriota TaxID=1752723 RepID=A0A0G0BHE4_9BACT|nr:MAG: 50S ribosomal protein L24 [Candidatus Roizmanbacteria bacterium GW2011_GWA2_33_33]KKP63066.1 MAG: 50S ribosomal protein L24 [Candidatus Roizmanbacteria bacterium GW2011_GWC2_34_23]